MEIPRALPAALGAVALLPTTAILAIHVILALSPADRASSVRITAIAAAALKVLVLVAISSLSLSHVGRLALLTHLRRYSSSLWFGTGLFLCTVGAGVSVSNLICLSRVVDDPLSTVLGPGVAGFLVGSSVVLGLAFASQLVFFVFHFVAGRTQGPGIQLVGQPGEGHIRPSPRIKSIPYHETSPMSAKLRGNMSFESHTPPGSSAGRSVAETVSSIRTSFSQAMRPISSRTHLLSASQRSLRRSASLDIPSSYQNRSRSSDGFDSWDTSAVDEQRRKAGLDSSSPPPGRLLETIPASPTTSRSPSPGNKLDLLEPPRTRRRSRSYSPASTRTVQSQAPRTSFTQHATQSESHIHPLFRSDSPTPPPIATPGTVVVAAPNGGQVISDRQSIRSIRSMRRMRSGSLPAAPSPLSRAASCDSFHRRAESVTDEIREEDEAAEAATAATAAGAETERKMTPPVPEWILQASSRASRAVVNNSSRSNTDKTAA